MAHSKDSTRILRRFRAFWLASFAIAGALAADNSTVTFPYLGVTHIFRVGSTPQFVRNVRIHVVKIDLTAPGIFFQLPPKGGTRDTRKLRTLTYANNVSAQIAMNMQFFNPVTSPAIPGGISADTNTEIIGFGASAGTVISPFERPFQNYAILRDSPVLNIDPNNNVSILTVAPGFSDGSCESCLNNDGLHVAQAGVTVWNAVSGSAQIVTNGVKTIPCYKDTTHPDCPLDGSLSPASVIPPYSNTKSWYELINARSSIGVSQDGKILILFTVDAAGGSSGMTIPEVADLMISYGAYQALAMDGGGSVSLAMEDPSTHIRSLVNTQSNGAFAREVANSLAVFAVRDLTPPHTTAQATPPPNVNGWNNSDVMVTLTAQDNPGGIVKQIEYSLAGAQTAASQVVPGNTASINLINEGVTTISFFAADVAGNIESSQSLTVRIDKTRPVISGMPVDCSLWPPNHGLVTVGTVRAVDALSGLAPGSFQVTGTSNEGPGDAQSPNVVVTPNGTGGFVVQLRAERSGGGNGRTYTLSATASDLAGNTATATATCTVPHDQRK
jgi:Phosphodiester glycosidase